MQPRAPLSLVYCLLLSACAAERLPTGAGEVRAHRAAFPPPPSWYEEAFDDRGWELLPASRLQADGARLYARRRFDLGPSGPLITDLYLVFPKPTPLPE